MARRRFQRGSVYLNPTRTVWLGAYTEYVLSERGAEKRKRRQVILAPFTKNDGRTKTTKKEAQRILQPYVDRVNASIAAPARENKTATLTAFLEIWERDYLSLSKRSTRAGVRSHLTRLTGAFGDKNMREIDAGDMQKLVAELVEAGLDPKTVRNLWATVRMIWTAALAQRYVDAMLPTPKLPRLVRKKPRFFRLDDVAKILRKSGGDHLVFYWLAAETGMRQGELAGLRLEDVQTDRVSVHQSVWNGGTQDPKTPNAFRTIAVSPQLAVLLDEQVVRQRLRGHKLLFTSSTGNPWDANLLRSRKFHPLLASLGIEQAGFHAFRHFNVSLLDSLRVPLKVIQERLGHALTGSFTLDVYGHSLDWKENMQAAVRAGEAIENAVNSVSLTALTEKGFQAGDSEALLFQ